MNARARYKQLHDLKAKALRDAGAVLETLDTLEGDAKATATATITSRHAEADGYAADLALFEKQFAGEAALSVPASARISIEPAAATDPMRGFHSAGDFARAVRAACHPSGAGRVDPRLLALHAPPDISAAPTQYHQEGHSSEGYLVPPAVRDGIWALVFEPTDLLGMVYAEDTERNAVNWARDETTPWGATGIQAKWRAEATQMTPSKLVTDPSQLRIHELYAFASATEEELEDAPLTESRLVRGAGRAIQWKGSEAVLRGTGAGQPLGWLNGPALITQTKEGSQTADTIVAKNILKMYSRALDLPGSRWIWLMTKDAVPQLVDLKIGNEPAWQAQNQGLQQAPSGMLLGRPIFFTPHAAALGDVGDILHVDLNGYYLLRRAGGVRFASSIHLYFDYNVSAFRWTFRIGGQPFLSAVVAPPNSQSTQSSYITLEARA